MKLGVALIFFPNVFMYSSLSSSLLACPEMDFASSLMSSFLI